MKIPNKQVQGRVEQLALESLDLVKNNLIWQENNRYHVFGRYEMTITERGCEMVSDRHDTHIFSSSRSALAWCIADKYQRLDVAQEIRALDQRKQMVEADIRVRSHLAQRQADAQRRESTMLKVQHRCQQLEQIKDRLDKCIGLAKYWQIRGFNNETARTGRSAPQRTNRPGF